MRKILIITYYWPPSGGAGVQRWLKFAKYLPEFGWQPVIMTVDPECASYPQRDESLLSEVDPNCLVFTTKSFELYNFYKILSGKMEVPYGGFANDSKEGLLQKISKFLRGNFLLPDPRKGWNKYALKKAVELIRQFDIGTVVTTSPPHSTQLIGFKLKKMLNIKWIADLRDPWTDIYYYNQFMHTTLARIIDKRYERKVVENADVLITVSEDVKRIFAEKSDLPIAVKTVVIPNGFDEDDFRIKEVPIETKKIITYTGTISEVYDVDCFLTALQNLDNNLKQKILIHFLSIASFSGFIALFLIKNKFRILCRLPFVESEINIIWSYLICLAMPIILAFISIFFITRFPADDTLEVEGNDIVPVEGNFLPTYIGMYVISISLGAIDTDTIVICVFLFVMWLQLGSVSYFNPFISLLGYRYYSVRSIGNKTITLITKEKDLKQAVIIDNLVRINNYTFFRKLKK